MKKNHEGFHGVKGRSGRRPISREQAYYTKLDGVLPEVVDYLISILRDAAANMKDKEKTKNGLQAAKILNDKAPQRISGGETPITIVEMSESKYASIIGREASRITESGKEEAN